MSDETLRRAMEIFTRARRLPIEQRDSFLDEACGEDDSLRAEVNSLIDSDQDASEFLRPEQLDSALRNTPMPDASSPARGPEIETIGPYRILETLGEGGMGTVYLAEQSEPLQRQVALKVIKLGMDTEEVARRFEAERQALAMLDHSGIAKVHDAGTTPTSARGGGRPFFVMELVPGLPITDHCDQHQLSTRKRLELYLDVCEAVQHAHQRGIIHRDIKPSNILVKVEGENATPKIIDFGIAKATHQQLTKKTVYTELGQLIGTPDYMSPEQAKGAAHDIDTRSDVYSLGVLLYELLVGALPFDQKALRAAGFSELQRIICEVEPPKPSTRLSELGQATLHIARQRQSDSRVLVRELRGDLDWIILMAMAKDRERRYASASELAADIERYLRSEPVIARAPSRSYVLRKYISRHRVAVTAAALVVLSLIAGIIGTALGYFEASRERDLAVEEAAKSKAVRSFLENMLGRANPEIALRPKTNIEQLLDWAEGRIDKEFAGMEDVATGVRNTIGKAYGYLGLYDKAEPLLTKALESQRRILRPSSLEHYETLKSAANVATELRSRARRRYGHELSRLIERIFAVDHLEMASMLQRTREAFEIGEYDDTVYLMQALVERYPREIASDDPRLIVIADHLWNYAATYTATKIRLESGAGLLEHVLNLQSSILRKGHPDLGRTALFLILAYLDLERPEDARKLAAEANDRYLTQLPPGHWMRAEADFLIGWSHEIEKEYEEADRFMRQGLDGLEDALGPGSFTFGLDQIKLIEMYDARGNSDGAVVLRQHPGAWVSRTAARWKPQGELLARSDDALGHSLGSWITANENAQMNGETVDRSKQRAFVAKIAQDREDAFDTDVPLALVYADLVHDQVRIFDQGIHSEVWEQLLREVVDIRWAQLPGHRRLSDSLTQLASCLARSEQFEDAEVFARKNLKLLESEDLSDVWGKDLLPAVLENRCLLGASLLGQKRFDDSELELMDAYRLALEGSEPTEEISRRLTRTIRELYGTWDKKVELGAHVEDYRDRLERASELEPPGSFARRFLVGPPAEFRDVADATWYLGEMTMLYPDVEYEYRRGDYSASFAEAWYAEHRGLGEDPAVMAFAAMALHQLGRTGRAEEALERLQVRMKTVPESGGISSYFHELHREAKELLGASK